MASHEKLITPDNLKSNLFDAAFGNQPHKVYVVYDGLMDEFIFKITKPDTLVAEFPISDSYALLVEPITLEVVGIQLSEFTTKYLPKMPLLYKIWDDHNLAQHFSTYQEIDHNPKDTPTQPAKESYYFYGTEKMDKLLATA